MSRPTSTKARSARSLIFLTLGLLCFLTGYTACNQSVALLGFVDTRGTLIPLQSTLTNHEGKQFTPKDLLQEGRPLILTLNFYHCANYCPTQLNSLAEQLSKLPFVVGQDVQLLTVSFDPNDQVYVAKAKYEMYKKLLPNNTLPNGWTFAVGDEKTVAQFLSAMQYRVVYDKKNLTYNHAQIAYIVTPSGMVSQILSIDAIKKSPEILRLALVEASNGKKGDLFDQIFLYCTSYNQGKNMYSLSIRFILLASGVATLIILGIFLARSWRREFKLLKQEQGEHHNESP